MGALVAMLLLAWLWHDVLMGEFYRTHSPLLRESPLIRVVLLGYVVLAALMAVIYPKGYEGGRPWIEGLRFGLYMGLLATLPRGIVMYAVDGSHTGLLIAVDAAWHLAEQGAGGVVIALIHGGNGPVTTENYN